MQLLSVKGTESTAIIEMVMFKAHESVIVKFCNRLHIVDNQ